MKAIQFKQTGDPQVLHLEEVATPQPATGQVLIKVEASGINFADTLQRSGRYPMPLSLPSSLGFEIAGTVDLLGAEVDSQLLGKRVAVFLSTPTGYAEYAIADAHSLIRLPDALSYQKAVALLVQGLTAHFLLEESFSSLTNKRILVHTAAGGVGSLAIQLAKLKGASLVIGTASSEKKLTVALGLGADVAVNYSGEGWEQEVLAASGGKGVDLVLDAVNGEITKKSLSLLAPFGRLITYGSLSGGQTELGGQEMTQLIFQNKGIIGFSLYGIGSERITTALKELFDYAVKGQLEVVIDHVFSLSQAAEAHQAIESRQTTGKVVLVG
jgi:NADPH2:quinone reductase